MEDGREFLAKLNKAVLANTMRPLPSEMKKIKVEKKILTSPKLEGDSKVGMVLFCGIAKLNRIDDSEVMDFLCIEGKSELDYKIDEFSNLIMDTESNEFKNKVKLVNNYLNLN